MLDLGLNHYNGAMSYNKLKKITLGVLAISLLSACDSSGPEANSRLAVAPGGAPETPDLRAIEIALDRQMLEAQGLQISEGDHSAAAAIKIVDFLNSMYPNNSDAGGLGGNEDPHVILQNLIDGKGYGMDMQTTQSLDAMILDAYDFKLTAAAIFDIHSDEIDGLEIDTSDLGRIGVVPFFNAAFKDNLGAYTSFDWMKNNPGQWTVVHPSQPVGFWVLEAFSPGFSTHFARVDYRSL
jgi:hypothetical protein